MKETFVNKKCELSFLSGFTLTGLVKEVTDFGVVFETIQKTAFINWKVIKDIKIMEE